MNAIEGGCFEQKKKDFFCCALLLSNYMVIALFMKLSIKCTWLLHFALQGSQFILRGPINGHSIWEQCH
jgi:hypothetical protein